MISSATYIINKFKFFFRRGSPFSSSQCDFLFTDGYELPNHGRQSVFPNGTLVIENAHKLHDEGFYTCTAFNSQENSHTGTIQIEVLSKFSLDDRPTTD